MDLSRLYKNGMCVQSKNLHFLSLSLHFIMRIYYLYILKYWALEILKIRPFLH